MESESETREREARYHAISNVDDRLREIVRRQLASREPEQMELPVGRHATGTVVPREDLPPESAMMTPESGEPAAKPEPPPEPLVPKRTALSVAQELAHAYDHTSSVKVKEGDPGRTQCRIVLRVSSSDFFFDGPTWFRALARLKHCLESWIATRAERGAAGNQQ